MQAHAPTSIAALALYIATLTQRPTPDDPATAYGERLALATLCTTLADMASSAPYVPAQ